MTNAAVITIRKQKQTAKNVNSWDSYRNVLKRAIFLHYVADPQKGRHDGGI